MSRPLAPPSQQIAPLWRRFAAMLYDTVVLTGICMFTTFLVAALFGIENARTVQNGNVELNPAYRLAVQATVLLSAYLFFGWFWTFSGQTLGMQAWKIRIQNADNTAISWKQVSLRYVTAPVSLALIGIGYFWMLKDKDRRTWPDISSGSVVVKVKNFAEAPD